MALSWKRKNKTYYKFKKSGTSLFYFLPSLLNFTFVTCIFPHPILHSLLQRASPLQGDNYWWCGWKTVCISMLSYPLSILDLILYKFSPTCPSSCQLLGPLLLFWNLLFTEFSLTWWTLSIFYELTCSFERFWVQSGTFKSFPTSVQLRSSITLLHFTSLFVLFVDFGS